MQSDAPSGSARKAEPQPHQRSAQRPLTVRGENEKIARHGSRLHDMRVIEETPNLIRLTRFGMVNCFLVREHDGFTLVDLNVPGSAEAILRVAATRGVPIRRVALTHAHFDHVGSLDVLSDRLDGVQLCVGDRESSFLSGDLSLREGETGRRLLGFRTAHHRPDRLLTDGDQVGSLRAIASPGHTPGHFSFFDTRDQTLIAGDAFITQLGVTAAGAWKAYFPLPYLFSWNKVLAAKSAKRLCDLGPARLAVGHGQTLKSPVSEMNRAAEFALRQCGPMLD
jgi:glyoxylase-like metal-dependent hydrolase (beta-lactamase superfamily II)